MGSYCPTETGITVIFPTVFPRSLRETFLSYRAEKAGRFTSERDSEVIYNYRLSKANAVIEGGSGAYSQVGTCLKFGQGEGTLKVLLGNG